VTSVVVPETGYVNTSVPLNVTLANRGERAGTLNLTVSFDGTGLEAPITVEAGQRRSVTLNASFKRPGRYTVAVGRFTSEIRIAEPGNVSLSPLPERAPPNVTVVATARNRSGTPLSGVRFRIGSETTTTDRNGTARIRMPASPGQYRLQVAIGNRVYNRSLRIRTDAGRPFLVTLRVTPETVQLPNAVEVNATAYNPWGATLTRELVLEREGESVSRHAVELAAGERTSVTATVEPATAGGTQRVTALIDDRQVGEASYTIEASDRMVAMLARLGLYERGSGLVRSLEALVGNFQIMQVTLIALAFLMGIGSTATVVIQAVHARRRTVGIRRVTGASPRQVVWTILGDGLRVGVIAGLAGIVCAYAGLTALVWTGYTVIFGVRIAPLVTPWLVVGVLGGTIALVGVSSLLAAWWVLRVPPGDLLTTSSRRTPGTEERTAPDPGVE